MQTEISSIRAFMYVCMSVSEPTDLLFLSLQGFALQVT